MYLFTRFLVVVVVGMEIKKKNNRKSTIVLYEPLNFELQQNT